MIQRFNIINTDDHDIYSIYFEIYEQFLLYFEIE